MKALSIRVPWTWAILHGGKRLENRLAWRGCDYRGPILLHASAGTGTRSEFNDDVVALANILDELHWCAFRDQHLDIGIGHAMPYFIPRSSLRRGGIVGRARIDGVIRSERDFAAYAANVPEGEEQRAWWAGGFALVLADVEALPFVPWKGALGLFEVPESALRGAA